MTLYAVRMPGKFRRQRRDRRRATPKPREPLVMYFRLGQLEQLLANVERAIKRALS